jgi:hypothetical protein
MFIDFILSSLKIERKWGFAEIGDMEKKLTRAKV